MKANAEGLKDWLDGQGYNATIAFNAEKAMYRVIVSSFADQAAAVDEMCIRDSGKRYGYGYGYGQTKSERKD